MHEKFYFYFLTLLHSFTLEVTLFTATSHLTHLTSP
jgi:hypothetical protein